MCYDKEQLIALDREREIEQAVKTAIENERSLRPYHDDLL